MSLGICRWCSYSVIYLTVNIPVLSYFLHKVKNIAWFQCDFYTIHKRSWQARLSDWLWTSPLHQY